MTPAKHVSLAACLGLFASVPALHAQGNPDLTFLPGQTLSVESPARPGGADPGNSASKAKLVRLVGTPMGANDGRLVVVYADADHDQVVWEPRGKEHFPRDVFARYSDDDGVTWSDPVNLSNTADKYSKSTDWDGDGTPQPYFGDSDKPNVFNNGNNVVVSWVDKYCPEATWTWGDSGESAVQGTALYPDLEVFPNQREVPYAGVYVAISNDGGATWTFGGANAPLQVTYGRRDAKQDVHRAAGPRWVLSWQEDPEGLQTGDAEGPGEGASGATVTKGTDVWYSWTEDVVANPLALRDNRTPLSNNSAYDVTGTNGYPTSGQAGSIENHGASRANLFLLSEGGGVSTALCTYEETKGVPDLLDGKTVQYHAFPFDAPPANGPDTSRSGASGTNLTDPLQNSRRVRFVAQPPNGTSPAIAIFWRQGTETQGGPSDVMMKIATAVDEASVAAAPTLNMSTKSPTATPANLDDDPTDDPLEDARAHRGYLRGDLLIIGYSYTWNGPLARYTDLANYDFWIRRSLDGGQTWLAPENLSNLPTTVNVLEPRLVGPPKTGTQDDDSFLVAWGSETNVYDGLEESVPLDVTITRTTDRGATYEPLSFVANTVGAEFESQLRPNEDVSKVFAVWMDGRDTGVEAMFSSGGVRAPLWVEVNETPATLGDFVGFRFHAPGHEGEFFLAGVSRGFRPGFDTPYGNVPLNVSPFLLESIVDTTTFAGFRGLVGPAGYAQGQVAIPPVPELVGLTFYTAFVVVPGGGQPWRISTPALLEIR